MSPLMSATTLRLAWRNLGRSRRRTAMAAGAIGLGQFAFLAVSALLRGYGDQFLASLTGPLVGHAQVHAPGWREDRALERTIPDLDATLARLCADGDVDIAMPRLYAPVLAARESEGFMAVVVGVDPEAEAHPAGLLGSAAVAAQLGPRQVLVGQVLARQEGLAPGTELAVVGQDADGAIASELFRVVGILPSAVDLVSTQGVVVTLAAAQEFLRVPDQAHEIVLRTRDPDHLDGLLARLRSLAGMAQLELLPWYELASQLATMVRMMDAYVLIILAIVCVAAAAGIANTMLMSTYERTRELGMLLALGCGPGRLGTVLLVEAVLLGLVGAAGGAAAGGALVWATATHGMDYAALGGSGDAYEMSFQGLHLSSVVYPRLYLGDLGAGTVAVIATALVAVAWPAWQVLRLEPVTALRT